MADFLPVILGGDIGAYAIAREFNDAYGVKPVLVTQYDPLPIRDSAILTRHYCANASEAQPLIEELCSLGEKLKREDAGRTLILLANTEWRIQTIAENRSRLEQFYTLPVPQLDLIEKLNDKESFEQLARSNGMPVPESFYEDFSEAGSSSWKPQPVPDTLHFPLIAKPAQSAQYEQIQFEGRQKVYRIDTQDELDSLWDALRTAGYRGKFTVQQLIEGDDTYMYSITAYSNTEGQVTFMASARVLLEEHHPATLGNPCAMVTQPVAEILGPARKFLESTGYTGFANFDVKRDPHTGTFYFLEVNPRIGRNSFYCVGAGINPMEELIRDLIPSSADPSHTVQRLGALQQKKPAPGEAEGAAGAGSAPRIAQGKVLYTVIPDCLLKRYITDAQTADEVAGLIRNRRRIDPVVNPNDNSIRRRIYHCGSSISQWRKFRRYYPKPTSTGF